MGYSIQFGGSFYMTVGEGAPEDVSEATWREACRDALVARITESREAR